MKHRLSRRQLLLMGAATLLSGCAAPERSLSAFRMKQPEAAEVAPAVESTVTATPEPLPTDIPVAPPLPPPPPSPTPLPGPTPTPAHYTITRTSPAFNWSYSSMQATTGDEPIRVLYSPPNGNAEIITLPLEEYIRGVVPHESLDNWPIEALKAQAVAARTFARMRLINPRNAQYDIVAGQDDQMWMPLTRSRSDAAVAATRGISLEYNGRPASIFFYSTSIGYTESNSIVLGSTEIPYLRGVPGAGVPLDMSNETIFRSFLAQRLPVYDSGSDKIRWSVTMSRPQLEQQLNQSSVLGRALGNGALGTLRDLRVVYRGKSGMVAALDVLGSNATARLSPAIDVRNALGLLSGWFVIDIARDALGAINQVTFNGGGWGHGLGMPQWGAQGLAMRGYNFQWILGYYFPGISLVQR